MTPRFISTDLGPYPGLLQHKKPGSRCINTGLLQNVMPNGFLNFKIQHVTSCFVPGHFVAIKSFYPSSGGISFCSRVRAAPALFPPHRRFVAMTTTR